MPSTAEEMMALLPGLDRLWALTRGHPEVKIAVLDGPVDRSSIAAEHLAPAGALEHGTSICSIIAGSADGLVPGIAPSCELLSLPIFDAGENTICTQERLAEAIEQAVTAGARIINISASQQGGLLAAKASLLRSVEVASAHDAILVAATGNDGCACDTIPASIPGVIAVGTHAADNAPVLWSNWGPGHRGQGLTAPGIQIPSACVGGGLCRATGTSFAAAIVSAVAGLLMSCDIDRGLRPSGSRIRRILLDNCVRPEGEADMSAPQLLGQLDVGAALDALTTSSSFATRREGTLNEFEAPILQQDTRHGTNGAVAALGLDALAEARTGDLTPASLTLADCGCGCGGDAGNATSVPAKTPQPSPQLVYAIGRIGVSFISAARRDATWRTVNGSHEGDLKPISNESLRELFARSPYQAQSVVWTLSRSEVPMYAIVPSGAFAALTYEWLVREWSDQNVEFVSMPGVLAGSAKLYDGSKVDLLVPDLRGMFSWQSRRYVEALVEARTAADAALPPDQVRRDISRFLGKIYFSIRNRGLTPEERALNSAATNAFNFSPVITEAGREGLTLRDIGVEKSPLNREGSEYYDVLLTFFNPRDRQGTAPLRARFTIDVSDTVPVMIGDPVIWYEY